MSEGWTARGGKDTGEIHLIPVLTTRELPLTFCLQYFEILTMANTIVSIARVSGLFNTCEPLPILSATTSRTLAKPGQGLNMKHHINPLHKAKRWAGTKFCCQIGLAQKSPKGAAVIWHTPSLIKTLLLLQRQGINRALADFLVTSTVTKSTLTH